MFKTIIIDDEKLAREKLKRLFKDLADPAISICDEAKNGLEAIEKIESHKPDFVILDIEMPGLNGFEVIRHLKYVPSVIFSTAYDHYAIRAFEIHAVDYLLKPYDKPRLANALERVKSILKKPGESVENLKKAVIEILQSQDNRSYIERLPSRIGRKIKLFKVQDIKWFDSEHSITFGYIDNQKIDVKYTLDELESRLNPKHFFRVHRSTIVNLDYVTEIIPWFSGKYKLLLNDKAGTELIVSRNRAQELKSLLKW
ncbi:response regulator transcription factor [bacterium]|nr:response regulator transcription factor [bacterium]